MTELAIKREAAVKAEPRPGRFRLWFDLLGSPIAWSIQLLVMYALVPWVCHNGHIWLLYITSGAFLAAAIILGWLAWRSWQRAGADMEMEHDGADGRSRFMSMLGLLSAAIFGLLIFFQGIPSFIIDPCVQ